MPPPNTASIANETSWNPSHVFIRKIVVYTFFGSLAALVAMLVLMPEQRMRIMGPILQAAVTAVAWIRIRRGDGQGALRYLAYGSWLTVTVTSTMAEEADGQLNLSKAARSLQDQKLAKQIEKLDIEIARSRGDLVERAIVTEEWGKHIGRIFDIINQSCPRDMAQIVTKEFRGYLGKAAKDL